MEQLGHQATLETRELGAEVEPLGRQPKAESGTQSLQVETRDPPALTPMVTGKSEASPHHRWEAGRNQREKGRRGGGSGRGRFGGILRYSDSSSGSRKHGISAYSSTQSPESCVC